ncbi:hypothetical protein BDA99DRAFT_610226 [Phascolomyces articulosus]|uniref:Heterokaryon incompatibility domain-containing protein n=1 Tax=Phascolomyces articulosus TaxID=60185 RepID=A0AAD5P724_9FUNG|nr:hypothetical protein BDA99DRAFT_610226 [Phascolomyces articulosus]
MYISYETTEWTEKGLFGKHSKPYYDPAYTVPKKLPKPKFMPNKLVRVSDMQAVDASQLNEGYCAISYSWNQSGHIFLDEKDGKYKRKDEGKHVLIRSRGSINDHAIYSVDEEEVRFTDIIQQICRDIRIKYIWYDQMCLPEDDEHKRHELSNMHHIYGNAYCTVAFVPEFCTDPGSYIKTRNDDQYVLGSAFGNYQWYQRLWTLEEALKSERLLFVGKDAHRWGNDMNSSYGMNILSQKLDSLNVSEILWHAHQRESTRKHDRVFALMHLFPDLITDQISFDYKQPIEDLMVQFYGLLAKKDISILYFQKPYAYKSKVRDYDFLPSWTGYHGEHNHDINIKSVQMPKRRKRDRFHDYVLSWFGVHKEENIQHSYEQQSISTKKSMFQNYDVIEKTLHVTCTYITNDQPNDFDSLTFGEQDVPAFPHRSSKQTNYYNLCVAVHLPGTRKVKHLYVYRTTYRDLAHGSSKENEFKKITKRLQQLSTFMEIKKESMHWDDDSEPTKLDLKQLTEGVDDVSAKYVLLSGILFERNNSMFYPVIKKSQGEMYYKAIGVCKIENPHTLLSNRKLPEKEFLIQ